MTHKQPRVVIGVATDMHIRRAAMAGLLAYQEQHHPWQPVYLRHAIPTPEVLSSLRDIDGMIVAFGSGADAQRLYAMLKRRKRPVVLVFSPREFDGLPAVYEDDAAIGVMAAEHLVGQGYRNLIAVAWRELTFSTARAQAFVDAATRRGLSAQTHFVDVTHRSVTTIRRVEAQWRQWLTRLPQPAAVFATDGVLSEEIAFAAADSEVVVPERVAILSASDDPMREAMSPLPVSAIDANLPQVGFEAARVMHRLLQGYPPPSAPVRISPSHVVVRRSTEALAIDDPLLADALRWLRNHALEEINVGDVLQAVPISRRALERGIRRVLNRSVLDELLRLRVAQARRLLVQTDMDMWAIADRCGFGHRSRLYEHFHRAAGMTPRQYRMQNRIGSATSML